MPRPQGSTERTDQFQKEFETAMEMFTDCGAEGGHEISDCDLFCPVRDECVKFYNDVIIYGPQISMRNHEEEERKRLKNEIKQSDEGEAVYWQQQLHQFMEEPTRRATANYFKKIEDKLVEFKLTKLESRKSLESSH